MKNDELKARIFSEISESSRYKKMVQYVVNGIKEGINPVCIEGWKADMIDAENNVEMRQFRQKYQEKNYEVVIRGLLNKKYQKPYQYPIIVATVKQGKEKIAEEAWKASNNCEVYFGQRDKNYIKLLFSELGYNVTEGNVGSTYGILISLK